MNHRELCLFILPDTSVILISCFSFILSYKPFRFSPLGLFQKCLGPYERWLLNLPVTSCHLFAPFCHIVLFLHLLRFLPSLFISLLTNSSVAPTLSPFSHVQGNIERRHKSLSDFEDICPPPPPSFIRVPARPPPRPAACRNLSTQIRCFQNGDYCHCSLRHIILYKKRRLAVYVSVCVL